MARDVSADFEDYVAHLKSASFTPLLSQQEYLRTIKKLHKGFLSLLTLVAELTLTEGDAHAPFVRKFGNEAGKYLQEVASDLGQAVFSLGAGAYKASLVTSRCSIESFVKVFSVQEAPDILNKKSVSEVFYIAKNTLFFSSSAAKQSLASLTSIYDGLNLYVHTVTDKQMFRHLSLGIYPSVNKNLAPAVGDQIFSIIRTITYCIALSLRKEFFKIHYKNRAIVLAAFTPTQRAAINLAE